MLHPSHGYGFWMGIGAFLSSEGVVGLWMVVLLLTCIANVKLFDLLKSYWITMTDKQTFLGTVMYLFIPLYWGTYSFLTQVYLIVVCLILMFDSERELDYFFWKYYSLFF